MPKPFSRTRGRPRFPALIRLLQNPKLGLGGGFVLLLVIIAVFAPAIAPHDPLEQDLMASALPPFWLAGADPAHLLGTDDLGRDVLSRLIFGSRVALTVAVVAGVAAGTVGSLLGLLAGYFDGWTDIAVSRLIEIWMAFPAVLLSILIVAILGSGVGTVIVAIAIIDWTRFARVIRADTMANAQADYVVAARTLGFGRWTILFREILPNVMPGLIALLAMEMGIAVVIEAILSFVGLSVSSDTPTWGSMIASGRQIIYQAWWVFAAPLAAVFATVLAFNQLGDGLRRALDPVMRR
ncbi:ABC transporter permease [Beijerinckia sp. L45]|uniref:ABC transporter permease n=1 Tax=Beijerinckia sp. L45 TaxID=1641855 RepID=UPI00131CA1C7|nr:ABC transporter permease [Beijerinckia sp. L45]